MTAAARPLYRTAGVNGKPHLTFDGIDDSLASAAFSLPAEYTVFAVARASDTTAIHGLVNADDTSGTRQLQFRFNGTVAELITFNAANGVVADATSATPTSYTVLAGVARALDCEIYSNGSSNGLSSRTAGAAKTSPLRLGHAAVGGGGFLNGAQAEVLFYGRALTTAERNQVTSYLGSKYGITVV
ncbi:MAG: hypothetical protein H0W36_02585 [Gemmatimonadetes bacterium]|nr:hypothetical protein [Gemmatimonadota bacterium]